MNLLIEAKLACLSEPKPLHYLLLIFGPHWPFVVVLVVAKGLQA